MEATVPTLWKMVYEKECRTIIVLYGLKESSEVRDFAIKRCNVVSHWEGSETLKTLFGMIATLTIIT